MSVLGSFSDQNLNMNRNNNNNPGLDDVFLDEVVEDRKLSLPSREVDISRMKLMRILGAKLRKHSKASESGIQEGDVLLGINGYSCRGLNHPTAMALVDQCGQELAFQVLRGQSSRHAVDAAFQALGASLQTMQASQLPQQSVTGPDPAAQHQVPAYAYKNPAPITQTPSKALFNGYHRENQPAATVTSRQHNTFQEGDKTRAVTTETSKQQFGGTTVTKVRREEVVHSGGLGPALSPYQDYQESRRSSGGGVSPSSSSTSNKPLFQVASSAPSGKPKPGVWAPSGQIHKPSVSAAPHKVSAPPGVNVTQNRDQSVTMSFDVGGGGKENVAPSTKKTFTTPQKAAPQFNVKKVQTSAAPSGSWQPNSMPSKPKPMQPTQQQAQPLTINTEERNPSHHNSHHSMAANSDSHFPFDMPQSWNGTSQSHDNPDGSSRMDTDEHMDEHIMMNIHLAKILHEGPGSDMDSGSDSPGFWARKKKIFADSSFYDDPQHKYPTIEEQIKMARKVALSLLSPANRNARGHKMFIKRKQKSNKWSTDITDAFDMTSEEDDDEKYFNPNPWNIDHTWKPPGFKESKPVAPPQPSFAPQPFVAPPPPPPAPPLPDHSWQAPNWRLDNMDSDDKKQALSANEVERMRLYGKKTNHTAVPPQVAFSLADDLRKMKGKGGRLFAKRKEKAEKWVVGETMGQGGGADPNIMNKLIMSSGHGAEDNQRSSRPTSGPEGYAMPTNRLQEMIEPPKSKMSPWASMAEYGTVEKAFDHLDGYLATKGIGSYKGLVAKNLDMAAQRSYMTPFRPEARGKPVNYQGPGKMPEFSSKIKGWGSTDQLSSLPSESNTSFSSSTFDPKPATFGSSSQAAFKPAHKSSLSASTPDINKQSFNYNKPTSSTQANGGGPGNDFLKPKAPVGYDRSQGPDMGLFFPTAGSSAASNPMPSQQRGYSHKQPTSAFTPQSSISSGSAQPPAGFRPVQFKAPRGSQAGVFEEPGPNAGVFDARPASWKSSGAPMETVAGCSDL